MADYVPRFFGYAHSNAIMEALKDCVRNRRGTIGTGYGFVEKDGKATAFNEMIKLAKLGGRDMLFVNSVKEFAGKSLEDFKNALTAINDAGMTVYSLTEPNYDYCTFMAVIEVLEDITPTYRQNILHAMAVDLYRRGIEIKDICTDLELSEADVYKSIADYKRDIGE